MPPYISFHGALKSTFQWHLKDVFSHQLRGFFRDAKAIAISSCLLTVCVHDLPAVNYLLLYSDSTFLLGPEFVRGRDVVQDSVII